MTHSLDSVFTKCIVQTCYVPVASLLRKETHCRRLETLRTCLRNRRYTRLDGSARLQTIRYYWLTPYSTVLLEKLTGFKLVKKFPVFYGNRRFITAFTSASHLSLSWATSIHSIPPPPTSWKSILILSSHLRLGLPKVSPPKPCTPCASCLMMYIECDVFHFHGMYQMGYIEIK